MMLSAGLKTWTKGAMRRLAPQTFGAFMSERSNRFAWQVLERDGIPALAERFVAVHGAVVAGGPFRGMQYLEHAVGSVLIPKLIGCYEAELHPAIEAALATPRFVVVDVGCAEGYYGVGLARRLPANGQVYAYDTDPSARAACGLLARRNGVAERVHIGEFCDHAALNRVVSGRALLVCDCEGYELELLDPVRVPGLATCDLIVELHDLARPGITTALTARFAPTHHIELIDAVPREPASYELLDALPVDKRRLAVSEYRGGPQQWAVMTPRSQG